MKSLRIRAAVAAVVLASLVLAPLRTAEAQTARVPVDRLLPPDVYVYLSVPSATEFKKRFNNSSYGELINDKAFAEFRKEVEVAIKKGSAQFEREVGLKLDDVLNLPSGEFAIAVAKSKKPIPNFAVFLDFGKHEETIDKILTSINKEVTKKGVVKRSTIEFEETRIVVYTPPFEDEKKKMEFTYFIKGSMLVLTNDPEFSKAIIARWDGKHESTFAKNEVYSYISERTKTAGREPVLKWYIDPLGLVNAVISNSPDVPAQARIAMAGLSFLGVTKFKAIGGSYDVAVGEYDAVSKSVFYVDLPTTGILNLFQFPATTQAPPKWVPQNAVAYGALNWDMDKAYKSVEAIFGLIPPGGPDALSKKLQEWADDPNGPKIHVKKDVLDQLTGSMTFYSEAPDVDNPAAMRIAFGMGVKSADKINDLLTKIAKLPNFPGKKRVFREHSIYEIDLATFGAEGMMGFGVAKSHLFICSNVTMLEKIILANDNSKSLADSKSYQRIAAKFPKKTSMITYQASAASQIKVVYDQLSSGALAGAEDIGIDFSKLPPFTALEKYLQASGGYTIPDKHGAYSESFSLKRQK